MCKQQSRTLGMYMSAKIAKSVHLFIFVSADPWIIQQNATTPNSPAKYNKILEVQLQP